MASPLPRHGALAHIAPAALPRPGALRLAELAVPGQIDLRGDAAEPRFRRAVEAVLGCAVPATPNRVQSAGERSILWLGPDEWLIVTPGDTETMLTAELRRALDGIHAAVVDVSGNRTRLRISGPAARETLMKGCSIDLHPRSFTTDHCAQTTLARAQIILHQIDETPSYDLYPRRSFAAYLAAWLGDAMAEFGGTTV